MMNRSWKEKCMFFSNDCVNNEVDDDIYEDRFICPSFETEQVKKVNRDDKKSVSSTRSIEEVMKLAEATRGMGV